MIDISRRVRILRLGDIPEYHEINIREYIYKFHTDKNEDLTKFSLEVFNTASKETEWYTSGEMTDDAVFVFLPMGQVHCFDNITDDELNEIFPKD